MAYPESLLDYGSMEGGLVRMMERYKTEGSLIGDPEADQYLMDNPDAALLGMLFDQRVRAEYAFTGPHRLRDRLGHLNITTIAAMDPDRLRLLFAQKPAVHEYSSKEAPDISHGEELP